ncbi:hypothetical protein K469DRAFT_773829 [Zopfia rhizophila CBS 207.26]|uniref:Protein kinase domain-containing protein n=1 Tax=Zopfia rhizophila CBS 207.26 TaxID=1314779 RepID=A0A6A6ESC8_9PEZI|nr:hypothetical protein K469DRAFT_773829 [Zopfia rhizophila CBS 207.26]
MAFDERLLATLRYAKEDIQEKIRPEKQKYSASRGTSSKESLGTANERPGTRSPNPRMQFRRQTTDFLKRQVAATLDQILYQMNFLDLEMDEGEVLRDIESANAYWPEPESGNSSTSRKFSRGTSSPMSGNFPSRGTISKVRFLRNRGFGEVQLYKSMRSGTLIAVKTLKQHSSCIPNEVAMLTGLGAHEQIVRYEETLEHPSDTDKQNLIFGYCEIGDLNEYRRDMSEWPSELFIWRMFKFKFIPEDVTNHKAYGKFCHYIAMYPRILSTIKSLVAPYSRLLNHFMMRTLNMHWETRITSAELSRLLGPLEEFVASMVRSGFEILMGPFNGGRDPLNHAYVVLDDFEILLRQFMVVW